ncbi:MAG: PqqD family protein [Mariprofundales bacterium]
MNHPQQQPNLAFEELEGVDEVIVINHDDNRCVSLNLTAAAVLEMCDGNHDSDAIATKLASAFEVELDQVRTDVETILTQLQQHQLLIP